MQSAQEMPLLPANIILLWKCTVGSCLSWLEVGLLSTAMGATQYPSCTVLSLRAYLLFLT